MPDVPLPNGTYRLYARGRRYFDAGAVRRLGLHLCHRRRHAAARRRPWRRPIDDAAQRVTPRSRHAALRRRRREPAGRRSSAARTPAPPGSRSGAARRARPCVFAAPLHRLRLRGRPGDRAPVPRQHRGVVRRRAARERLARRAAGRHAHRREWNLKCPLDPSLNWLDANVNADPEWTQEEDAGDVPADRAQVPRRRQHVARRRRRLHDVSARTRAEWAKLEALRDYAGTLLLESPHGWARYVRILGRSWTETGGRGAARRKLACRFLEVGRALMYPVTDAFREPSWRAIQRAVVTIAVDPRRQSSSAILPVRSAAPSTSTARATAPSAPSRSRLAAPRRLRLARDRRRRDRRRPRPRPARRHRASSSRSACSSSTPTSRSPRTARSPSSAADRSRRIAAPAGATPTWWSPGEPRRRPRATSCSTCWPDARSATTIAGIDEAVGTRLAYLDGADSDPWKDARALAAIAGLDLYFDGAGVAQVRDTPDPESDPVVWTYDAGDEGVVLGQTRKAVLSPALQRRRRHGRGLRRRHPQAGRGVGRGPAQPDLRRRAHGPRPATSTARRC